MSVDRPTPKQPPAQDMGAKKAESQRLFAGERLLQPAGRADLLARARRTSEDIRIIQDAVAFSPFLEIGAGTGVRSLQLSREFGAQGVAADISLDSLRSLPIAAMVLKMGDLPLRICCDSHSLPFMDNTFRFVFAYRTLHHSSNPVPVVSECFRVLTKSGHFFFNEEPMTSPLRDFLRANRQLSTPRTPLQNLARRFGLEKVFWDDGKIERSVGISEQRFERWLWMKALEPFEKVNLTINSKLQLRTDLRQPGLRAWLAGWVGGNVRGLCEKRSGEMPEGDFVNRIICLDCRNPIIKTETNHVMQCEHCGRRYPIVEGIVIMLPHEIEKSLYRERLG